MKERKIDNKKFVIATFGNLHAMESATASLNKVEGIDFQTIGLWTLVVRLKNGNDDSLRGRVSTIMRDSKGYIEKDLKRIQKSTAGKPSALDYPIFG